MKDKIHKIIAELDYGSAYPLPIQIVTEKKSVMISG